MSMIVANGVPEKHPGLGEIRVVVKGNETEIEEAFFWKKEDGKWVESEQVLNYFMDDMDKGPTYPLCAEPNTMRCAYFVLLEWFGEADKIPDEKNRHVKLAGEIEPMESEPGVIY